MDVKLETFCAKLGVLDALGDGVWRERGWHNASKHEPIQLV
jgi:hypothetical protein